MTANLPVTAAKLPPTRPLHVESLRQHELTDYRQKIGTAVETMMDVGAYYDRARGEALSTAVLREWIDRLEGWTTDQIRDAFRAWQDQQPSRRPNPAHIVQLLKAEWGRRNAEQTRAALAPPVEPPKDRISDERRRAILIEAGLRDPLAAKTIDGITPSEKL